MPSGLVLGGGGSLLVVSDVLDGALDGVRALGLTGRRPIGTWVLRRLELGLSWGVLVRGVAG